MTIQAQERSKKDRALANLQQLDIRGHRVWDRAISRWERSANELNSECWVYNKA